MIEIQLISEAEFQAAAPPEILFLHEGSCRYARVALPGRPGHFYFGWRSDLIDPLLVEEPVTGNIWIGVDLIAACLAPNGRLLFSMTVPGWLLQIRCFEGFTALVCDWIALVVGKDYSMLAMICFDDLPITVDAEEGKLAISFEGDVLKRFDLPRRLQAEPGLLKNSIRVIEPGSGNIWLGEDRRVTCVHPDGRSLGALGLWSPVLGISHFDAFTAVLCTQEAVLLNRDFSIRSLVPLRHAPATLEPSQGGILVTYEDGSHEALRG